MGHQILGVGITGPSLTDLEKKILSERPPYAVVLFGRNIVSEMQLRDLIGQIRETAGLPPLLMIDEEGGRVDRFRNLLPGLPSVKAFSEGNNSAELSEWFGRIIGMLLGYFDIDINLAPVVDIEHEDPVKGLERRCFGTDAKTVVELAGRFIRGHHEAGVATCLKHFPGIGRGSGDPHYGATVIDASYQELVSDDLVPYIELGAIAKSVMIGHGSYPQIEDPEVPASLSRRISTELLRNDARFDGLAVSDDMEMHAVADLGSYEMIADKALVAGNDIILFCSHIERVPQIMSYLDTKADEGGEFSRRYEEALARGDEFRRHCASLRASRVHQVNSFDDLVEEARKFCDAFREAHADTIGKGAPDSGDRRNHSRTPGTGKTGREEWT